MTRAILLVVFVALTGPARADVTLDYARSAVADLRASSYLPSACESAFAAFWRAFIGQGPQGMVREPGDRPVRPYFGYGALAAGPLLPGVQQVCAEETGVAGQAVVQVLQEREEAKRTREAEIRRASRAVTGY